MYTPPRPSRASWTPSRGLREPPAVGELAPLPLLIVGEPPLFAEALACALGADPQVTVVGSPRTIEEAEMILRQAPVAVALLNGDDRLARIIEQVRALRGASTTCKVLVLATQPTADAIAAYFRAGAIGCITREASLVQLVGALQQAQQGALLFSPEQVVALATQQRGTPRESLTSREQEVLQALARGGTSEQAAAELGIRPATLRTHLQRSMTKLGARSRVEAVVLALQAGLIQLPGAESADVQGYLLQSVPPLSSPVLVSAGRVAPPLVAVSAGR